MIWLSNVAATGVGAGLLLPALSRDKGTTNRSQGSPSAPPHLREGVGEDNERGSQVQGHPLAQVLHRGAEVVGHLVRLFLAFGGLVHLATRKQV